MNPLGLSVDSVDAPAPQIPPRITLQAGRAQAVLYPEFGCSLAEFFWQMEGERIDWLRPTSDKAVVGGDPMEFSCFALVPFSNRIREGRFPWAGEAISLPRNWEGSPHPIHGHGWQAPWRVLPVGVGEQTGASVAFEYVHPPDAWPFAYRARQRFSLSSDALQISLELRNEGQQSMPAGLGFHPYFPRTPKCRIFSNVQEMWLTDRDALPAKRITPPKKWRLGGGVQLEGADLDHVFTGWDQRAVIEWPERNARLRISAEGSLRFLVVFSPRGEDFFCIEPVSHCTDAFNHAGKGESGTGTQTLAPGATLAVSMTLTPEQILP